MRDKYVVLSLVLLVFGFLVTFSYQQTKEKSSMIQPSDQQWEKDYFYRQQLNDIEKQNKALRQELQEKRQEVQQLEADFARQEETITGYVEQKQKLQMLTGELPVTGQGVQITLRDAAYVPSEENANQYIVHEQHIHRVVNELLSAGAEAISINGQRIFHNSHISCTGPVVTIDGRQHPAPFTIAGIGEQEVLLASVNLTQGIVDELVSDNIEVEVEAVNEIKMKSRMTVIRERGLH